MKYDLPPELSTAAARSLPSMASYLQALQSDLPDWLSRAVNNTLDGLNRSRLTTRLPAERAALGDVWACLNAQRGAWTQRLAGSLAQAMDDDLAAGAKVGRNGSSDALSLSLLEEDAVDEDIALSRLVQTAESDAEATLRDLAARCSSMRGLPSVSPDANPMRPAVVAGAVRRAVADFGLPTAQRVLLLRELGSAIGTQLVAVYARQCEQLVAWGVEPSRFTLRLSVDGPNHGGPSTVRAPASGPTAGPGGSNPAEMVAQALRGLRAEHPAGERPPDAEVMAQLVAVLLSRVPLNDSTRALMRRLDAPARRIATHEPQVWSSPDHPLWQLLDRLVTAGSVHGTWKAGDEAMAGLPDALHAALEHAVQQLETASRPDADHCEAVLTGVDVAISSLHDEQVSRVAPQAEALHQHETRADVERRLREQIVQLVRNSGAPPPLRQFLVGPWASVLAHTAALLGADSVRMKEQAELVDELMALCNRPVGERLSRTAFTRCITHARLGLGDAAFPSARVHAELADLERVLLDPWQAWADAGPDAERADDERADEWVDDKADDEADGDAAWADPVPFAVTVPFAATAPLDPAAGLGLHEALPTVPMDMLPGDAGGDVGGLPDRAGAWLDSLEPGQFCRLFLLERWMNTHLVWRSAGRTMFVFSSRHGGRTHSLSRRSLQKLRAAGLAATIERGQFVAQAMRELAGEGDGFRGFNPVPRP